MSSLAALPTEILNQITLHLVTPKIGFEDNGICNLRLTCRALCLKTQYEFGRAAFSTLRVDLHPNTLQQLLNICKQPAFGQAVKKLLFAHWGDEYIAFPHVQDNRFGTIEEQVHFVLRQTYNASFRGLPNLKEVVFITPLIARFRRYSYALKPSLANIPVAKEECAVTMEALYTLVMQAIADADVHVSSLEVMRAETPSLERDIPVAYIYEDAFATTSKALKHVERLAITIHQSHRYTEDGSSPFGQVLKTLPLLNHLDVTFARRTQSNDVVAARLLEQCSRSMAYMSWGSRIVLYAT
jgi:hypothetical protein